MFDTRTLRIFLAVARGGSFSRAAAEVHLAQSSVSDHIQTLEADLGAALFARTNRGATLTAAGEAFAAYAEDLLALTAEARDAVADAAAADAPGPLVLGTLETIAATRLPAGLAAFRRDNPDIELKLTVAGSGELLLAVERGEIDAAICFPRGETPVRLVAQLLAREPLVLIGAPGGRRDIADLAGLAAAAFIATAPGCAYRQLLDEAFTEAGLAPPKPVAEVASLTAVIAMAAAGAGLALVPRFAVADDLAAGRVADYGWPGPELEARLMLIRRRGVQRPALRRFIRAMTEGGVVRSGDAPLRRAAPSLS